MSKSVTDLAPDRPIGSLPCPSMRRVFLQPSLQTAYCCLLLTQVLQAKPNQTPSCSHMWA